MIPDQLVEQLHRALVDEIRVRRPEYLLSPFTVAEIYQDLVPYRTHRDRIGAAMNGDYEHALLRLLAGEGDYVRIESEPARKRMEEELGSSNPNTGLFRDFAALDVRLNPARIPDEVTAASLLAPEGESAARPERGGAARPVRKGSTRKAAGESPGREAEAGVAPAPVVEALAPEPASAGTEARALSGRPTARGAAGGEGPQREQPAHCRWCREALPQRASLRFCPFCGMDVTLVPCPSCNEELEPGWRFCIACGTEVTEE